MTSTATVLRECVDWSKRVHHLKASKYLDAECCQGKAALIALIHRGKQRVEYQRGERARAVIMLSRGAT